MRSLICPVSPLRIDRNVARITALLMAALVASYAIAGGAVVLVMVIAAIDYFIRGFTSRPASPVSALATRLREVTGLPYRPTDKAPKIFAARVGFLFAATTTALHWLSPVASIVVGLALMGFALLESLLDICVGCLVYTYVVKPAFG